MAIKLDLETVKRKAREAYYADRLSAQHSGWCSYRDKNGHPCAIGAAIDDGDYKEHFEGTRVKGLVAAGHIEIAPDEIAKISAIQRAHDEWCCLAEGQEAELYFCDLIDAEARLAA